MAADLAQPEASLQQHLRQCVAGKAAQMSQLKAVVGVQVGHFQQQHSPFVQQPFTDSRQGFKGLAEMLQHVHHCDQVKFPILFRERLQ